MSRQPETPPEEGCEDGRRTHHRPRAVCHSRTRLFIYSYGRLWQPVLRAAEVLGLKYQAPPESWLPPEEVRSMLWLADYEVLRDDCQVICPGHVPLLSDFLNRFVGHLPGLEWLSLMYGIVARPAPHTFPYTRSPHPSTSVIVPCRNEAGHIRKLAARLPELAPESEEPGPTVSPPQAEGPR